jgi:hypothetical protein
VWSPLPVLPGISLSVSSHISQVFNPPLRVFAAKIQRKNESSKDYPLKILACYNLTHVLEYSRSSGYNLTHVLEYYYSPFYISPPLGNKKNFED